MKCVDAYPIIDNCVNFISILGLCSKCDLNYRLKLNWPVLNIPNFICGQILVCQINQYVDTNMTCQSCYGGSRGKIGCDTCSFKVNVFVCSSCQSDFSLYPTNTSFPCKKQCLTNERVSTDGASCISCSSIDPYCSTCTDYTNMC